MKKYVMIVLASTFIFSLATFAQEQTPPQVKIGEQKEFKQAGRVQVSPEKNAERMASKLGLTDAEKAKVQELFEKQDIVRVQHQTEIKKLREEQIAKFESERKAQDTELEKIIGKDKFQKFETDRSALKAKVMERRERNQRHQYQNKEYSHNDLPKVSPQIRAERMAKTLGLTDTEKAKVLALFEKLSEKKEQFEADAKKFKDEKKAQFETERKSMNADLEKIIGQDKYQKLENKKSEIFAEMKERHEKNQPYHQGREWQMNEHKQANRLMVSPEKHAEFMAKELGLNDTQKADVQALFEKQNEMRHQQMEKAEKMREEMRSQFEVQHKTNDEALTKIIGQEKFQKLQAMRAEQMEKMKEKMNNKKGMHENHSQESNGESK